MKKIFSILALCAFAAILAPVLGAYALPIALGASVLNSSSENGLAFSGLNREIWLAELMEGFYADEMFIS